MNKNSPKKSDLCFPKTDAISTYVTLQRTHDAIHRQVSTELAKWGMSIPKYGVILQLYNRESLAISEIGNIIFRCNSNLTTLIDRMERDGLVERTNCNQDRRVKKIRLTEKGRELAPNVISEFRRFLDQTMNNILLPKEQKALIDLLNRVKAGSEGNTLK